MWITKSLPRKRRGRLVVTDATGPAVDGDAVGQAAASCPQFIQQYPAAGPRTLPKTATLSEIITVVNNNSSKIRSLYTTDATVSATLIPSLRANLALERPRRFRIRAETGLTGPEVDLGSNDRLFWLWVRRLQPPSIYYCTHQQFPVSRVHEMVPVEPDWLIEALGITGFDPAGQHSGPTPMRGGRLEIRTQVPRDGKLWTKATIVDAARGLVLEQHLYDQNGTRVATSITSQHAARSSQPSDRAASYRDPMAGHAIHVEGRLGQRASQSTLGRSCAVVRNAELSGTSAGRRRRSELPAANSSSYGIFSAGASAGPAPLAIV